MELSMTNSFEALLYDEMEEVDGDIGFILGLGIGVVVGAVCDGVTIASTGKSMGEWVFVGVK